MSKSPLNSGFKTDLNDNENQFSILYQAKHIPSNTNGHQFDLDQIILDLKNCDTKPDTDIIICKSKISNCLLAFFDDAFTLLSKDKIVRMALNDFFY